MSWKWLSLFAGVLFGYALFWIPNILRRRRKNGSN